jgi:hypothetical protein
MFDILNEFKSRRVKHVRLTEVYRELQNVYRLPDGEAIYLLVGPIGAGKTRLVERVHQDCLHYYREEMASDPGSFRASKVPAIRRHYSSTSMCLLPMGDTRPLAAIQNLIKSHLGGHEDRDTQSPTLVSDGPRHFRAG